MSKDDDSKDTKSSAFVVAPVELRKRVEKLVKAEGLASVRKKLTIGESALLRILSGLEVRQGTIALVEKGLSE